MILIVTEDHEITVELVCKWLRSIGKKYYIIRISEPIEIVSQTFENGSYDFTFRHNQNILSISQFGSIWFRRGWFTLLYEQMDSLSKTFSEKEIRSIESHVKDELKTFQEHLYHLLSQRTQVFGNVNRYDVNKLDTLICANEIGLTIPEYCITTSKSVLLEFQKRHETQILSKAIRENIAYRNDTEAIFHVNNTFSETEIHSLPDYFQTTLFQVYYENILRYEYLSLMNSYMLWLFFHNKTKKRKPITEIMICKSQRAVCPTPFLKTFRNVL